jgi:hypothetical protein
MKLLIMQFPPISRHIIPLWSKYSPQHPVLKHPQSEDNNKGKKNVKISLLDAMEAHGLREVNALTLLRQTANRWRQEYLKKAKISLLQAMEAHRVARG